MVNQISNQTENQSKQDTRAIPLCSRCIVHEISNWVVDKRGEIDPEASQQIREELKDIKLTSGECIVCNNKLVSENTFDNIIKIFQKQNIKQEIKEEFKKLFSFFE